jgi:ribosomal protein S18 acetylase RimI-like enzyme
VTLHVRRLRADEAAGLRELRMRALRDAPAAFAATLAASEGLPLERWAEWTRAGAAGETHVTIVAVDGERRLGMVLGRLLDDPPRRAWLEGLWVDPSVRRSGVGSALIEAVAAWSRERGADALDLSVTENNEAAAALYAATGFVKTGRRRPLPADPSRIEVFLSRRL